MYSLSEMMKNGLLLIVVVMMAGSVQAQLQCKNTPAGENGQYDAPQCERDCKEEGYGGEAKFQSSEQGGAISYYCKCKEKDFCKDKKFNPDKAAFASAFATLSPVAALLAAFAQYLRA